MSCSAREKVYNIRYAQSQVKKLQKELQRSFPDDWTYTFDADMIDASEGKFINPVIQINPYKVAEKRRFQKTKKININLDFDREDQLRALEERAVLARLAVDENRNILQKFAPPPKLQLGRSHVDTPLYESPFAGMPMPMPSVDVSQDSTLAEFPMHLLKDHVPLNPKPPTRAGRHRYAGNNQPARGLIFRHRYKFEESVEPTPEVSTQNLPNMEISKSILISKAVGNDEYDDGGTQSPKKVMWADEVMEVQSRASDEVETASTVTSSYNFPAMPFPLKKGSEYLTMSSLVNTRRGPDSWINRRFPEIAPDLQHTHKLRRAQLSTKEDAYSYLSRKSQRPRYNIRLRPLSPDEPYIDPKHQPLPHRRGLTGFEISNFDSSAAFFFRNRKGVLNPHWR